MDTVRTQTQNKNAEACEAPDCQKKQNDESKQTLPKQPEGIDNAPVTKKDKEANELTDKNQVTVNDCTTPDNANKNQNA